MVRKKKILSFIKALILWLLSILVFIPLLIILLNSLKTQGESVAMEFSMPTQWVLGNYQESVSYTHLPLCISSVLSAILASCTKGRASRWVSERRWRPVFQRS